jgi:hypothetical protein
MTNGAPTTVHFQSHGCDMNYTALQQQQAMKQFGSFDCADCGAIVHEWNGFYDFSDWVRFIVVRKQ